MEVLLMKKPRPDAAAVKQERNFSQSVGFQEACSPEAMKDDELECAKAEMGEVKEENERLKSMLEQIQQNYNSLQLRFFQILQQGAAAPNKSNDAPAEPHDELVSLSLGRSASPISTDSRKDEKPTSSSKMKQDPEIKAGLTLGLLDVSKFELSTKEKINVSNSSSPENSSEEPPSKIQKTTRNNIGDEDHQVVAQQNHVKRARVSVRARCDAPTMNDGCQWRKYGQKIAKGNPCPRAYYRCTVAPGCPVRKQVQRCVEDMSILITTYEGNHNHPLPISATAMASTTSAAASMLLSASSTSNQHPSLSSTLPTEQLNGLNFSNLHESSTARQFYITNSPLFPTITLDLTGNSPSSSSNYFNRNFPTTASLNFSSSESNVLPTVWANGCPAYGSLPYNQAQAQTQDQFYPSLLQKNASSQQSSMTETLTKAITSDPGFRSVIAAAISSMVGSSTNAKPGGDKTDQTAGDFGQNLMQTITQNLLSTQNIGKESSCASSYFTGLMTSSSSKTGSSPLSSLPFSVFNSAYTPASENKELKN